MHLLDFVKHLRVHGCILLREGGNHTMYMNPANGKRVPVPRHREIKNLLAQKICKQLEIPQI
jgi:mRNA interferase HicA